MNKINLKGSTWDHSRGYDPLVACCSLYVQQESVYVGWQKRSLKDFGDASLITLADDFDLLVIDHPHIPMAVAENCLVPFNRLVNGNVLTSLGRKIGDPSFSSYNYDGMQWALPVDAATQIAVLRPDLYPKPAPTSWQQVLDIKGVGMALCPTDAMCSFLSLAAQKSKTQLMHSGVSFCDEATGVDILSLLLALRKVSHPDAIDWNPIDVLDYMSQESDICYAPLIFGYNNYSRRGFSTHTLHFHNVPELENNDCTRRSAILGGAGIAISAHCKHPKAAAQLAMWLSSQEVQKSVYFQNNGQPAHYEAWNNSAVNLASNDFFTNTSETLSRAWVRPKFPWWPSFQRHVGDVINDYLVKPGNARNVIAHLNDEYVSRSK